MLINKFKNQYYKDILENMLGDKKDKGLVYFRGVEDGFYYFDHYVDGELYEIMYDQGKLFYYVKSKNKKSKKIFKNYVEYIKQANKIFDDLKPKGNMYEK